MRLFCPHQLLHALVHLGSYLQRSKSSVLLMRYLHQAGHLLACIHLAYGHALHKGSLIIAVKEDDEALIPSPHAKDAQDSICVDHMHTAQSCSQLTHTSLLR